MRNETEMLLQVWADVLRDVQNDKEFVQQVERAAQDAAFRTRSGAVWAEVMRRLQDRRAAGGGSDPMQYKLTIPGRLPGLNELIEAERANRYKGAQLKKDAERRICAEIRRQLHGVHIRRPVVMRYLWVEPDRRRDRDNIAAGRKFVQDALVRCKVLQNDGWKEIAGFSDDWAVDKARPRVEITITEMEEVDHDEK